MQPTSVETTVHQSQHAGLQNMSSANKSLCRASRHNRYTQQWLDTSCSGLASSDESSVNLEEDQGFAARLYWACLRVLGHLCGQAKDRLSSTLRPLLLKDELGKLYLWGESFGLGELDDALDHADDLRNIVLNLLGDVGRSLLRELWASAASIESAHAQQQTFELKKLVGQIKTITTNKHDAAGQGQFVHRDGDDTDEDSSSDDDGPSDTIEELGFATKCLVELGPTLHQNLRYAEKARIQSGQPPTVPFCVSGPAWIYVLHVREKYRQAQGQLVERLGEANWQRHRDVRERRDQIVNSTDDHSPIAQVEDDDDELEREEEQRQEHQVPHSLFRPYSAFHDSGIGTSVPAQTNYAQSHTSFLSSNTEGEHGSPRVPPTPVEVGAGKPFQCYLCGHILSSIKNRVDWKIHVFADLKPYICTFPDCEHELAQFQTRAGWADHEFAEHRIIRSWACPECPEEFASPENWENHLQERHDRVFSGPKLQLARKIAYKTQARPIEDEECPLCQITLGKPRRAFVKHVGRHMEEIALVALPQDNAEDSEAESVTTDQRPSSQANIELHHTPPRSIPSSVGESKRKTTYESWPQCEPSDYSSLSRERHPKFGNKTFSGDQSADSANPPSEDISDWPSEPDTESRVMAAEDTAGGSREGRKCQGDRVIESSTAAARLDKERAEEVTPFGANLSEQPDTYTLKIGAQSQRNPSIKRRTKEQSKLEQNVYTPNQSIMIKPLPTIRDHTTDLLYPDQIEYIPREYDDRGEAKVSPTGETQGGRQFNIRTFRIGRSDKRFMLANECARVLGYRDPYLLFNRNRTLHQLIATQAEKDDLIQREILPYSYRSRRIAMVTAKSIFRQFGSRVIKDGRRVRDDYWEAKAIKQGFTEEDMAGDKRPGATKAREAAAALEANNNPSTRSGFGQLQDMIYADAGMSLG